MDTGDRFRSGRAEPRDDAADQFRIVRRVDAKGVTGFVGQVLTAERNGVVLRVFSEPGPVRMMLARWRPTKACLPSRRTGCAA